MCNPTQDGGSIDNAANYTSSLDVHYSSGVYNKAFCNLAKTTRLGHAEGVQGDGARQRPVLDPEQHLRQRRLRRDDGGDRPGPEHGRRHRGVHHGRREHQQLRRRWRRWQHGGPLTKGVTVTGIGASTGATVNYTLVVPAGATNLVFTQSGGTGDADMYVKFGSAPTDTVYDCRPYVSGNAETCTFATAQAGTYYVRLKAYSTFSGVSLKGDYTTGGGGGGVQTYTNSTATSIPDNSTITSTINVSGRTGNAPTTSQVAVNITHTYRGDLKIDLLAPDGSVYALRPAAAATAPTT